MIIRKFGIELSSIRQNDLELIRTWRNQDFVRNQMVLSSIIDEKSQVDWFNNLTNSDIYLLIIHNDKRIGVINVKNIDYKKKTGEAGLFIGEKSYLKSPVPILATLGLMDTFFLEFDFTKLHATVLKENSSALDLNKQLGFTIRNEEDSLYRLSVNKNRYEESRVKFKKLLLKLSSKNHSTVLTKMETQLLFPTKDTF